MNASQSKAFTRTLACALQSAAVLAVVFMGCTKTPDTQNSSSHPASSAAAPSASPAIIKPQADATGAMKCPDGSAAIHVTGTCKGTWHVAPDAKAKTGHNCVFEWNFPTSCKAEGYADSGSGACYGPPWTNEAPSKGATVEACTKKFGTPPNGAKFDFYCCKG